MPIEYNVPDHLKPILNFLNQEFEIPPTTGDVAKAVDISALTASKYLKDLARMGKVDYIEKGQSYLWYLIAEIDED